MFFVHKLISTTASFFSSPFFYYFFFFSLLPTHFNQNKHFYWTSMKLKSNLASITFAATLVLQASKLVTATPLFNLPTTAPHLNDASIQDICEGKGYKQVNWYLS